MQANSQAISKKTIGLALSGGGARGIAHLGVLKAFDELGIKPTLIAGSSAGAVVGAFYAAGYEPDDIYETLTKTNVFRFLRPAISKLSFLKLDRTSQIFKKFLPTTFGQLEIPLIITATEINLGKTFYFKEGDLLKSILASCSMPIIFEPIKIGNNVFVDGGVMDNLPVDPLIEANMDIIIGVHVNPKNEDFKAITIRSIAERSFQLALSYNVKERKPKCDIFIEPQELKGVKLFEISKSKLIFEYGYQAVMNDKEAIMAIINA
ncbi:MAG: hypothetical protein RL711_1495 [Bacteroidota bacterium]|jgi:NTE family protein